MSVTGAALAAVLAARFGGIAIVIVVQWMYAIGMRRVVIDYLVAIVSCDSDIDVVVAASVMTEFGREHFAFSPTPFPFGKSAPPLFPSAWLSSPGTCCE